MRKKHKVPQQRPPAMAAFLVDKSQKNITLKKMVLDETILC
jgi:hypothetical protein